VIWLWWDPRLAINDGDYQGGFSAAQIEELLDSLADNYLGWSAAMAPAIMGNSDRPELGEELTDSFCRADPEIAKQFARATFMSDNRADLHKITARTLMLQCSNDVIAAENVGEYVNKQVSGRRIIYVKASGHCPNLSAPDEVISAINDFV
jgi:sigma-B regulation protein RsbQ